MSRAIHQVVAQTAKDAGVTVEDILGHCRKAEIVQARHAAMAKAYRMRLGDKMAIAKVMNRDQTSVHHAIQSEASEMTKTDDTFAKDVIKALKSGPLFASQVRDIVAPHMSVHHVACRLRWLRNDNIIDSQLQAKSTLWGLPGAFDKTDYASDFEDRVLAILSDGPKFAREIADQMPGGSPGHVGMRMRKLRDAGLVEGDMSKQMMRWRLPKAPQPPSERPATRTVYADATHAVYSSATTRQIPITLPIEPWAAEAAQ
jgi:hypothetical protein